MADQIYQEVITPAGKFTNYPIFYLKGDIGPIGATGPQGTQGMPGSTGPKGDKGIAGGGMNVTGPTGAPGVAGSPGTTGQAGATGPIGYTGNTGHIGPAGSTGISGPAGVTGATGNTGSGGAMGETGIPGSMGDTGSKGVTGTSGIAGTTGDTGAKGTKGDTGTSGSSGDTGVMGSKGANGVQGPSGDTGMTGASGSVGTNGIKGSKGTMGFTGDNGPTGPNGAQGQPGAIGVKGSKGDQGPPGDTGDTGATGYAGPKGVSGQLVANHDLLAVNVGATGIIPVLNNDMHSNPISSLVVSVIPNPTSEGTAVFSGDLSTGNITFIPAPRFLTTAIFGYEITDTMSNTSSAIVEVNVNTTYMETPRILYANGTDEIQLFNPITSTSTFAVTLQNYATELASNLGDALLYYAQSGSNLIYGHDYVTGQEFTLLDVSTVGSYTDIYSLGFDQKNYFLYVGFDSGNVLLKIAVDPYNRYAPGLPMQTSSTTPIIVGYTGSTGDIAVEYSTGYLFLTVATTPGHATPAYLYKINPVTGNILLSTSVPNIYTDLSFGNDNVLYLVEQSGNNTYSVDTSTLELTLLSTGAPYITDMATPLFDT